MTVEELREKCEDAKAAGFKVLLVVPGPAPRGNHKRLAGRRGPLGEFVSQGDRGSNCYFDPEAILQWLAAEGV